MGQPAGQAQQDQAEVEFAAPNAEEAVSSDAYIEYMARLQFRQGQYQEEYIEAAREEDSERVQEIRMLIEQEAYSVMDELGITPGAVSEFERQNPGFLQDPAVQKKIEEKKQVMSQ